VSVQTRAVALGYQALYSLLLARLPEATSLALGQATLRTLPLDAVGLFRKDDPRLSITLAGVRLPNPLILSSMYYDPAILRRAMGLGFGAVTAKSITPQPRPGHPEPNLLRVSTPAGPGLINCNGFRNPGLDA
jgi:dihydroorotate dehydrogenase